MAGFSNNGLEVVVGMPDTVLVPPLETPTPLPNLPPGPPLPGQFSVIHGYGMAGNVFTVYPATQPQPGIGMMIPTDAGPGMLTLCEATLIVGSGPGGGSLDLKRLNSGNCMVAMDAAPGQVTVMYLA